MSYVHLEIQSAKQIKYGATPCGDVWDYYRAPGAAYVFLADGMGSGVKANIAATMCAARLKELIKLGYSLQKSVVNVAETMIQAAKEDLPYAVFSIAAVLTDGATSVLSFEMPAPLAIIERRAYILERGPIEGAPQGVAQSFCTLAPRDAIMLVSDGITQAGIGRSMGRGWGERGVASYLNGCLIKSATLESLPSKALARSIEICEGCREDDATAILAYCKPGVTVSILTGPPSDPARDAEAVETFDNAEGIKIICGGTTASIYSRITGKSISFATQSRNDGSPPASAIKGIDLVTEGVITLNQLNNIWNEDREEFEEGNPVTELYDLLNIADKIVVYAGESANPANEDMRFRRMGLRSREKILPVLLEKFRRAGKLALIQTI
ncbi:MAG: SpoIIE family protein phosphatase [Chloroflexota bacterium]